MSAEPNWLETPARLYDMLAVAGQPAFALKKASAEMPVVLRQQIDRIYYQPEARYAHVVFCGFDKKAWDDTEASLGKICPIFLTDSEPTEDLFQQPWMPIKCGNAPLSGLATLTSFKPNFVNRLFGGPSPLAAGLSGGLLGAGLGYGAGWLGEQFLPKEHFNKGRLRKALAILGGLGGAAPGIAWGISSAHSNPERPGMGAFLHGWPMRDQDMPKEGSVDEAHAALMEITGEKSALAVGRAGAFGLPPIDVDAFNRVVWQDPQTPMAVRAATTGLTESASMLRDGADLISPADVGRIAAGMGSGWVSGMLVGKALGALAGLKPETQQKLQQTGMWAGALTNVIPMAFRRI